MRDKAWSVAGWLVAGVLAVGVYWVYQRDSRNVAEYKAHATAMEERAKAGPYFETTKAISDTETVKVLVLPNPLSEYLDKRCVVYTNHALRTSAITCLQDSIGRARDE